MELFKHGKTKDVYVNADGSYTLVFKNTVTGHASGEKDPGGNSVVGEVDGVAFNALKVTVYYFELLKKLGIPSHYLGADLKKQQLHVMSAKPFGQGLEFICRYEATGSFVRRYGHYIKDGTPLDAVFEVTLKDDERGDPPATKGTLEAIGLLTKAQYDEAEALTKQICTVIKDDLAQKGLTLIDIKLEFGLINGKVTLIDEISAGNMRVYRGREKLSYEEISEYFPKP